MEYLDDEHGADVHMCCQFVGAFTLVEACAATNWCGYSRPFLGFIVGSLLAGGLGGLVGHC